MSLDRDLPSGPCHLRATYNPLTLTGSLPDTVVGDMVEFSYSVATPNTPAICVIASGFLPAGLSMDEAGNVSGQVTTAGSYAWTVKATDSFGYALNLDDMADVEAMTITGHLPQGVFGSLIPVSYQYTVTGGVLPRVVSIESGSLPTGLSMDDDGLVTGKYEEVGVFGWAVRADDADGNVATLPQDMEVIAITALNPSSLSTPSGSTGGTISEDNLTLIKAHDPNGFTLGAMAPLSSAKTSGKFYIEITVLAVPNPSGNTAFGVFGKNKLPGASTSSNAAALVIFGNGAGYLNANVFSSGGPGFSTQSVTVGLAIDASTGKVWWRSASGWNPGGDPATGVSPFKTINATYLGGGLIPFANTYSNDGSCRVNFGQEGFKLGDVPDGFFGGWSA